MSKCLPPVKRKAKLDGLSPLLTYMDDISTEAKPKIQIMYIR